jgi:hypothetical protein
VVIAGLILYSTGFYSGSISNLPLLFLALCIFLFSKHYRDKKLGGFITYGQGLGVGTLIGVFAGILFAFFTYVYIKFIDTSFIEKQLEIVQSKLLTQGMSEDEVEKATEFSKKFMTPGVMFISSIFSYGLVAFIISLITAAILKKEKDPFTSQMEGIE